MILPQVAQTTAEVAAHYDELDEFYRELWGEHVHHGYWKTGRESAAAAVEALIDELAGRLALQPGQAVCDIGCGYGGTARYLAGRHGVHVTGVTVSAAQARQAQLRRAEGGSVSVEVMDWLANDLPAGAFDGAYAVESSEHMPDKQRFFDEAYRVLKPGGRFAVCAWLSCDAPRPWEIRYLLEPICREGRLPGMGDEADYRAMAQRAGFAVVGFEDLSALVQRTWWICAARFVKQVLVQPRYLRFLLDRRQPNRIFAVTLFRLLLAYRTRAMRYCLLTLMKPEAAAF